MLPVKSVLLPSVSRFFEDDWNTMFDWKNRNFPQSSMTLPAVNIKETGDAFFVEMAAPGMKREDFHIQLLNNVLTIKSEFENNKTEEEGTLTRREFSYQSFERSFNLNSNLVDDSKIKASYQNGILNIALPKKEEVKKKPARRIEIR